MVSKKAVVGVGIVGAVFLILGGTKLVKPAIENAKETKSSLSTKIKDLKKRNQS